MADFYTTFSFEVEGLTPEEAEWLKVEHRKLEEGESELELSDPGMAEFQLEVEGPSAWFHSDESGNPDQTADFLQAFLQKWRPEGYVSFEWAETCSKLRADSFGGGAVFVTAEGQEWMDPSSWLREQKEKHEERLKKKKGAQHGG